MESIATDRRSASWRKSKDLAGSSRILLPSKWSTKTKALHRLAPSRSRSPVDTVDSRRGQAFDFLKKTKAWHLRVQKKRRPGPLPSGGAAAQDRLIVTSIRRPALPDDGFARPGARCARRR